MATENTSKQMVMADLKARSTRTGAQGAGDFGVLAAVQKATQVELQIKSMKCKSTSVGSVLFLKLFPAFIHGDT